MKLNRTIELLATLIVLGMSISLAAAEPAEKTNRPEAEAKSEHIAKSDPTKPAIGKTLTVAVLDFTSSDATNPSEGGEIAAALTAMLSSESGITLVERQSLMETVREHELNLTGLVNEDQAIKVGKLVGAKIMVTGRAFRLGKELFITAKIIGTETSLVEGVMVKDALSTDMAVMVVRLSEKVADDIRHTGSKLVASADDLADPVPALKKKLAGRRKPVVTLIIREQHHGLPHPEQRESFDPAVETEIKKLLIDCGFTVNEAPEKVLAVLHRQWIVVEHFHDWRTDLYRRWIVTDDRAWPSYASNAQVLIAGEAFSEFAARIGNIVSCSARVEINVVDRQNGKIILADRDVARAADLSENIAAKKALQTGGRAMAIRILESFAETLPMQKGAKEK